MDFQIQACVINFSTHFLDVSYSAMVSPSRLEKGEGGLKTEVNMEIQPRQPCQPCQPGQPATTEGENSFPNKQDAIEPISIATVGVDKGKAKSGTSSEVQKDHQAATSIRNSHHETPEEPRGDASNSSNMQESRPHSLRTSQGPAGRSDDDDSVSKQSTESVARRRGPRGPGDVPQRKKFEPKPVVAWNVCFELMNL